MLVTVRKDLRSDIEEGLGRGQNPISIQGTPYRYERQWASLRFGSMEGVERLRGNTAYQTRWTVPRSSLTGSESRKDRPTRGTGQERWQTPNRNS